MIKNCLHIIKGGSCKDGIASVFELFINNSKIDRHLVLTILPVRYPSNIVINAEVHCLLSLNIFKLISLLIRLRKLARSDSLVIKTWGHASAFISRYFCLFIPAPVIWGIHDAGLGRNMLANLAIKLNSKDSYRLPHSIICVSQSTLSKYSNHFGYDSSKLIYIANGIDPEKFKQDPCRSEVRRLLKIPESSTVIGMVSRYCKEKGVDTFVKAMHVISKELPDCRFIFCGFRMDVHNSVLVNKLKKLEISDKSILLGQRSDMPSIYSVIDILVLPSLLEAQSCCLIEAMSCGVSCVSTDVGDSRIILGEAGRILQKHDPQLISDACKLLISENQQQKCRRKKEGREWVVKMFDLNNFINKYDAILTLQSWNA